MKNLKKSFSLLLALCLTFTLFACGGSVKKVTLATGGTSGTY